MSSGLGDGATYAAAGRSTQGTLAAPDEGPPGDAVAAEVGAPLGDAMDAEVRAPLDGATDAGATTDDPAADAGAVDA